MDPCRSNMQLPKVGVAYESAAACIVLSNLNFLHHVIQFGSHPDIFLKA